VSEGIGKYELVSAGCGCLIARPPEWRDDAPAGIIREAGGVIGLQARFDAYAQALDTPYYQTLLVEMPGARPMRLRWPVVICETCEPSVRRRLQRAAARARAAAEPVLQHPGGSVEDGG
jgi:hypothetical protein